MKRLVFESLNEMNFQRKMNDPLGALGIGQKSMIEKWLKENDVRNYNINDDLTIDVNNCLDLNNRRDIIKFPDYIQFNETKYYVSLTNCNLTSLKGCPQIINDHFFCDDNSIISLEGCPTYVKGEFFFQYNRNKKFTEKEIRKRCKIGGSVYL
jgi:hypothetical protein